MDITDLVNSMHEQRKLSNFLIVRPSNIILYNKIPFILTIENLCSANSFVRHNKKNLLSCIKRLWI